MLPQRRTVEHYRLSGSIEIITGMICYGLGFLAAGATVLASAVENVYNQDAVASTFVASGAIEAMAGSAVVIAAGVFLHNSGQEHLTQAENMASKSA